MWFTRVSINNPVFATMIMAALCVLGLFSYAQLRVERLPDISPPVVFVSVTLPGASPDAIETDLTRPIELGLNGIAGVKMIRSNSLEGRSETVVEFTLDADLSRAVWDPDVPCRDQDRLFERRLVWLRQCWRSVAECGDPVCIRRIQVAHVTGAIEELV